MASSVSEAPSHYRERVLPRWSAPLLQPPGFLHGLQHRRTARQKIGLRYEHRIQCQLQEQFELRYIPSQWWKYHDGQRIRYCQFDGLLLNDEQRTVTIVEIKYSHTSDAYWQLENVYVPVLRAFLKASPWLVATCEVVKWFDGTLHYPRQPTLVSGLDNCRPGNFSVHIMSPNVRIRKHR